MATDIREYHPKWTLISRLIRKYRAGWHCEFCGIKNGALIMRQNMHEWRYATLLELDSIEEAVESGRFTRTEAIKKLELTKIVLTVAHLDHNKNNNDFANLRALCQSCHLHLDRNQHIANRKYGRHWDREQQGKLPFD